MHGLTTTQLHVHYQSLLDLMKTTTVWPSPMEMLEAGAKLESCHNFFECYRAMGLSLPRTQIIAEPTKSYLDNISAGDLGGVMKREYSSACQAIFTPDSKEEEKDKILKIFHSERSTWFSKKNRFFPRPRWFLQPYIPQLAQIGEFRAFIVNGVLYYAVCSSPRHKNPMDLEVAEVSMSHLLSRLR